MSNLIEHSKNELDLLLGKNPEEGPDKWMKENAIELITVFSNQGHSGSSAPYVINLFKRLANFENLSPLTFKEDEWSEIGNNTFQNKRMSAVFKEGEDGDPYYLDAIIWETKPGICWHSSSVVLPDGSTIGSAHYIDTKRPFYPKTFKIKVREEEVSPGDWVNHLDDTSQLEEVFKYYIRRN